MALLIGWFFVSCTAVKLPVPDTFSAEATKMPVKGLNGWMVGQRLSFGEYETSKVKRGWDFTASVQYTRFRISPEEAILKVFDISTDKATNYQRNRFQYTLTGGGLEAEIWATEKFRENQLVYKSNNPYIGNASKTTRYEYSFAAAVVPLAEKGVAPWSVVIVNRYDVAKDTARRLFHRPYVEEEGYATDGTETIAIRPLRLDSVSTAAGKTTRPLSGQLLSGYELQWQGKVASLIDILDNSLWMANHLSPQQKLIVGSVASAILLKRMQDVENDRGAFDR